MRCPRVSNEQGERVADVGATPLGDLHADTVVRHTGRPQARWDKLSAGGDPKAQQCGWLKDKYGASWQVAPNNMDDFLKDEKSPESTGAIEAMMRMKKIDMPELRRAHD